MQRLMLALGMLVLAGATCLDPLSSLSGFLDPGTSTGITRQAAALRTFASAEEMRNYFAEQAIERLTSYDYAIPGFPSAGGFGCAPMASVPSAVMPFLSPAPSADTETGTGDVFSTTNIQEAGVDESDVVKNDGDYLYVLTGDSVRIVQAAPPEQLRQLANVALPATPDSLYLRGDKLIALSRSWSDWTGQCTVSVVNIADRSNPTVDTTLTFDGALASSRLIGNRLHLVLTATPPLPYDTSSEAISSQSAEAWMPDYQTTGPDGSSSGGKTIGWQDVYRPADPNGYGITMVVTIDVDNPGTHFQSKGIAADAGTIYASTSALYVTDASYSYYGLTYADTAVHKFDLTGEAAQYTGSGLVPGHLLNQYSLGEKDGYLRVATTSGEMGGFGVNRENVSNAVYVLGDGSAAGTLDIVGRIEDIARGEKLYSARFVGSRGFLVTFKKVDPLFTVDLADPRNPQLVGELKVPGYSDYIHLMDETHLLTLGKDSVPGTTDAFDWYQGVQLSIFDVSVFANPTLLHREIIGVRGTESEAASNPKAFNYFAPKNALAIPIDLAEGPTSRPDEYGTFTCSGLYLYRVTVSEGFNLLGRIITQGNAESPYGYYYYYLHSPYVRGVFIGDDVYAVTENGVRVVAIGDANRIIGSLDFSLAE